MSKHLRYCDKSKWKSALYTDVKMTDWHCAKDMSAKIRTSSTPLHRISNACVENGPISKTTYCVNTTFDTTDSATTKNSESAKSRRFALIKAIGTCPSNFQKTSG